MPAKDGFFKFAQFKCHEKFKCFTVLQSYNIILHIRDESDKLEQAPWEEV